MSAEEQAQFLSQLAEDLNSRNVELPSFPDVVINIRKALEDPTCSSERLAAVVRTDPVLVARLLIAANSAFHNRAGIEVVDLHLAISRLGFEVVRNTAITLAVEQIFAASEDKELQQAIKGVWSSSLSLASMSFVIARNVGTLNPDNAFLCGLLHEIGKLYILTRASKYPNMMGDSDSLNAVIGDWYQSVGKSIIEAWGFAPEIAASVEVDENLDDDGSSPASLVDVVHVARTLLNSDDALTAANDADISAQKLEINAETMPSILGAYELHAQSLRQSVSN